MNNKGFLLIQVLLGLFLLGLASIISLSTLSNAMYNLNQGKIKMEMIYTAESIIEQIKSFDYKNYEHSDPIFDLKLIELVDILHQQEEIKVTLPLNRKAEDFKFNCEIFKIEKDNLWELKVNIISKNEVKRISDVEITALLPIPKQMPIDER